MQLNIVSLAIALLVASNVQVMAILSSAAAVAAMKYLTEYSKHINEIVQEITAENFSSGVMRFVPKFEGAFPLIDDTAAAFRGAGFGMGNQTKLCMATHNFFEASGDHIDSTVNKYDEISTLNPYLVAVGASLSNYQVHVDGLAAATHRVVPYCPESIRMEQMKLDNKLRQAIDLYMPVPQGEF